MRNLILFLFILFSSSIFAQQGVSIANSKNEKYGFWVNNTNTGSLSGAGFYPIRATDSAFIYIDNTGKLFIRSTKDTVNISGYVKIGTYSLPKTSGTSGQILKINGSNSVTWQNDNNSIDTIFVKYCVGCTRTNGWKGLNDTIFIDTNYYNKSTIIDYLGAKTDTSTYGDTTRAFRVILNSWINDSSLIVHFTDTNNNIASQYDLTNGLNILTDSIYNHRVIINQYITDSSKYIFWEDTLNQIVTIYKLDTLTNSVYDSIYNHRVVINTWINDSSYIIHWGDTNTYIATKNNISTLTSKWSILGNSGTSPSTNFIGTTDNQPIVFRSNNLEKMRLLPSGALWLDFTNTAVGDSCQFSNPTGTGNSGFGRVTQYFLRNGYNNSSFGLASQYNLRSGYNECSFGVLSLASDTSGHDNIGIGNSSLYTLTSGNDNIAIGTNSQWQNLTGKRNITLGTNALFAQGTATGCIGIGYGAGASSGGNYNIFIGDSVGYSSLTIDSCILIGRKTTSTLYSNFIGIGNNITASAANKIQLGNSSHTLIGGYTKWTNYTDNSTSLMTTDTTPTGRIVTNYYLSTQIDTVTYANKSGDSITINGIQYPANGGNVTTSSADSSYGHIRAIRPNSTDTLFYSIDAAFNSAQTNWYLEMFPGTYTIETNPPDSITLYCHDGVVINSNDTALDLSEVYGFNLQGRAEINATNYCIFTDSNRSDIKFSFKKIESLNSSTVRVANYGYSTSFSVELEGDSIISYGDDVIIISPQTGYVNIDASTYATAGNGIYLSSRPGNTYIENNTKTASPSDWAIYVNGSAEDSISRITNNGMVFGGINITATLDNIHFTQNGNVNGNCYVKAPAGTQADLVINGALNDGVMTFYNAGNNYATVAVNGNTQNYHINISGSNSAVTVNGNNYNIENLYNSTRYTISNGVLTVNGYTYLYDATNTYSIFTQSGGTTYLNGNIDYRGDGISLLALSGTGIFVQKGDVSGTSSSTMLSMITATGGTYILKGAKLSINPTTASASAYLINWTGNSNFKHMGGILYTNNAAAYCMNVANGITVTVRNYQSYYANKIRLQTGTGVYTETINVGGATEMVDTDVD